MTRMSDDEIRDSAWDAAQQLVASYENASRPVSPFELIEDFGTWIEEVEVLAGAVAFVIAMGAVLGEDWDFSDDWL